MEKMTEEARFPAAPLGDFVARAFIAAGLPQRDAQALAGLMVEADLRGSDTHGVIGWRFMCAGCVPAASTPNQISDSSAIVRQ